MHSLTRVPIDVHSYTLPKGCGEYDASMVMVEDDDCFSIGNDYYKNKMKGSIPTVFLRGELVARLRTAWQHLPPGFKFHIFDGFRTFQGQQALFDDFLQKIIIEQRLGHDEAFVIAKRFCTLPSMANADNIPHLSGGAVDLSLMYEGEMLDMGTGFDEPTELSKTDYFEGVPYSGDRSELSSERWDTVRKNRRLLFNCLVAAGFTNYENEWWHYDFGNCFWANSLNVKQVFGAAEALVREKMGALPI